MNIGPVEVGSRHGTTFRPVGWCGATLVASLCVPWNEETTACCCVIPPASTGTTLRNVTCICRTATSPCAPRFSVCSPLQLHIRGKLSPDDSFGTNLNSLCNQGTCYSSKKINLANHNHHLGHPRIHKQRFCATCKYKKTINF